MYLALNQDHVVTIANIADTYKISENHLTKVVHYLGQQAYIKTIRGKGGGMRLNKTPAEISLGDLFRKTEGKAGLLPCVNGEGDCCIMSVCRLIAILNESQQALYQVFDKYTLADLVVDKSSLSQILTPS
ncbi:Nitrite-sensitive transcriptional repressor NsrR [Methylophaga thiooxydans]|uniref:Nitrite-sensitive transcriptional repressor NsrR n=2 Tax=Methylophaga thiooxydans TaxID=392484 RepID=A0A0A0BE39_9GAMM|nr:Nitrite-sensitive transcriptional repressor NsrR [Methylophaga thiooxydans]